MCARRCTLVQHAARDKAGVASSLALVGLMRTISKAIESVIVIDIITTVETRSNEQQIWSRQINSAPWGNLSATHEKDVSSAPAFGLS
jgi:hypothetical protein